MADSTNTIILPGLREHRRRRREDEENAEIRRQRGIERLRRYIQRSGTNAPAATNSSKLRIPKKKNGYYPLHGEE